MKLTQFERQVLKNQHEILEKLSEDPSDKKYHSGMQEVYFWGYEYDYFEHGVVEDADTLSPEDGKFVFQVVNMYDDLYYYWENTEELKTQIDEYSVSFPGFDLNDPYESKLYSYVKHLMENKRIFHDTRKLFENGKSLNSHGSGPKARGYKQMLTIFDKNVERRRKRGPESPFTLSEMKEIIEYYKHT